MRTHSTLIAFSLMYKDYNSTLCLLYVVSRVKDIKPVRLRAKTALTCGPRDSNFPISIGSRYTSPPPPPLPQERLETTPQIILAAGARTRPE